MVWVNLLVNSCVKRLARRNGVKIEVFDTDDVAIAKLNHELERVEDAIGHARLFLYELRQAQEAMRERHGTRKIW